MMGLELVAWLTVMLGVVLTAFSLRAVFYFSRKTRILGGSWVLSIFRRVSLTVTVACAWLTLARALSLTFGVQWWSSIISGLVIVWLLALPLVLQTEFERREQ